MKVTNIITANVKNLPLTDDGKLVYETMLKTGARSTEELQQHLDMSEGMINLMLAHLLWKDLVEVKV